MMKARTATYLALALLGLLLLGRASQSQGFGAESNFAGAFTALADDENAAFYNPAGLAFLSARGLTSLYSRQFELLDYSAVGFAGRSIGFQLLQLFSAGIERTNNFGNPDGTSFSYLSRAGLDGAIGGLTLGSSVWVKALRFDWAYALHPFLPDSSRLSLTLRF